MIDSGSTSDFVSSSFVAKHHLSTSPLDHSFNVFVADGRQLVCQDKITYRMTIGPILETISLPVIPLEGYDIVFGQPWLQRHNPSINWHTGTVRYRGVALALASSDPEWSPDSSLEADSLLPSTPRSSLVRQPIEMISALQAKRLMKHNHRMFFVHVVEDAPEPVASSL